MALLDRIQKDLVEAMKAKDELRLSVVRSIKAALLKYRADKMKDADEAAEQQILTLLLKQRHEAAEMFHKVGRAEQAAKEESEAKLIETYMPELASEDDIRAAIDAALASTGATEAKQMGMVINAAKGNLSGKRVDGKALADAVKARLS
jgi:uncharacterized protein YqeY